MLPDDPRWADGAEPAVAVRTPAASSPLRPLAPHAEGGDPSDEGQATPPADPRFGSLQSGATPPDSGKGRPSAQRSFDQGHAPHATDPRNGALHLGASLPGLPRAQPSFNQGGRPRAQPSFDRLTLRRGVLAPEPRRPASEGGPSEGGLGLRLGIGSPSVVSTPVKLGASSDADETIRHSTGAMPPAPGGTGPSGHSATRLRQSSFINLPGPAGAGGRSTRSVELLRPSWPAAVAPTPPPVPPPPPPPPPLPEFVIEPAEPLTLAGVGLSETFHIREPPALEFEI